MARWISRTASGLLGVVGIVLLTASGASPLAAEPTVFAAVNAASFDKPISPGCLITIWGQGLSKSTFVAPSAPWPTVLGNTRVQIAGSDAPLHVVSPAQINVLVPFGLAREAVDLVVFANEEQSAPFTIRLTPTAPGIFTKAASGKGPGLLLDANFRLVDSVSAGAVLLFYATGLGVTSPPAPANGLGSAAEPFNRASSVEVMIGGKPATVLYAGLAPGLPAVYQVNVKVPAGMATRQLYLRAGGRQSNVVDIDVDRSSDATGCFLPITGLPRLGDTNGDGVVTAADADHIRRWLSSSLEPLTCAANADATEDGDISEADAAAIADRVNGQSRSVVASVENGFPGRISLGATVRLSVTERFFPFRVRGGTLRIRSASTNFDSGDCNLVFEKDGRSLYYQWDTTGLKPAEDYTVYLSLVQDNNIPAPPAKYGPNQPAAKLSLSLRHFEVSQLSGSVDASAPAPGLPMVFQRAMAHDSFAGPYLGPFGRGWRHNFDIHLIENSTGLVTFVGASGSGRRFLPKGGGTYASAPGDNGVLTRDSDGTFQLRELNGIIYRFLSDLRLSFIQDANGNRITASYNTLNQLTAIQHSNGAVFNLVYNSDGRICSLTDHLKRTTTYDYDPTGAHLVRITDAANRVSAYTYSGGVSPYVDDRLESVTYPDGSHSYVAYDALGRVSALERDEHVGRTSYAYLPSGETVITDSAGGRTTVRVNDKGQPVQVQNQLGAVSRFEYDAAGNLLRSQDPLGRVSTNSYDAMGNLTRSIDALSGQNDFAFKNSLGRLTSLRDSRDNQTGFSYDDRGNLTRLAFPDGSFETYTYDARGQLASKRDRKGQVITYEYDQRGLLLLKTYPDRSTVSFSYDGFGNPRSVTDAQGMITFQYNSSNRLTGVTYPGNRTFSYQYDVAGRRVRMVDPKGNALRYRYDQAGRLVEISDNGAQSVVLYEYDKAGRRAKRTLANGVFCAYEYDAGQRLTRISNVAPDGKLISFVAYSYDAAGNVLAKRTNDGTESYTYDDLNRLISVNDVHGQTTQYAYDAMGNRNKVTIGLQMFAYTSVRLKLEQNQLVAGIA